MAPPPYRGYGPKDLSHLSFSKARFSADFVRPTGPAPDPVALAKEPFNGAVPANHNKPDFTLPASVITYHKTHQSGSQGTS
jgi:hypothetical protein